MMVAGIPQDLEGKNERLPRGRKDKTALSPDSVLSRLAAFEVSFLPRGDSVLLR